MPRYRTIHYGHGRNQGRTDAQRLDQQSAACLPPAAPASRSAVSHCPFSRPNAIVPGVAQWKWLHTSRAPSSNCSPRHRQRRRVRPPSAPETPPPSQSTPPPTEPGCTEAASWLVRQTNRTKKECTAAIASLPSTTTGTRSAVPAWPPRRAAPVPLCASGEASKSKRT